jgi:hypothetical protein
MADTIMLKALAWQQSWKDYEDKLRREQQDVERDLFRRLASLACSLSGNTCSFSSTTTAAATLPNTESMHTGSGCAVFDSLVPTEYLDVDTDQVTTTSCHGKPLGCELLAWLRMMRAVRASVAAAERQDTQMERYILRMGLQASPFATAVILDVPEAVGLVVQAVLWLLALCGAVYLGSELVLMPWW